MEFRGLMGGFYRISEWIMRLSVINLLWIFCSIPFFFLLLSLLMQNTEITADLIKQWLLLQAIVSPFTLIPASAAVFTVARKWVTGDPDVPLLKTFFRGFKENYKQSMLGGFLYELIAVILYVNYVFYRNQHGTMQYISFLFILFMVLLGAAFLNYLSIMVHFHMKLWQILKNSLLLTIGNPIGSIGLLVTNGLILYLCGKFTFLIPFFMGSLMAIVTFFQFHRGYERMRDKVQQKEEEAAERAAALEAGNGAEGAGEPGEGPDKADS